MTHRLQKKFKSVSYTNNSSTYRLDTQLFQSQNLAFHKIVKNENEERIDKKRKGFAAFPTHR
ncbi:hypothetical protein RU99_GL001485 [Enterococcus casseliflavus]|nr:hypothetical protein RU99_GL001485 [Enterococcus casseliflavus]